jgi:hypothetical protein
MSAFIVTNQTMNLCVDGLAYASENCWNDRYQGMSLKNDQEKVGQFLFAMNTDAVNQRYNEDTPVPEFQYLWLGQVAPVASYKALQCLLYQCSEGDVPERTAFKELQMLVQALANRIISNLPAYEAADWDAEDQPKEAVHRIRLV